MKDETCPTWGAATGELHKHAWMREECRKLSFELLEAFDRRRRTENGAFESIEAEAAFEDALLGIKRIISRIGVFVVAPIFQDVEREYRQQRPSTQIPNDPFGVLIAYPARTQGPKELSYYIDPDDTLEPVDEDMEPMKEDRGWKLALTMGSLEPAVRSTIEAMPFTMSRRTGWSAYKCQTLLYDLIEALVAKDIANNSQKEIKS